MVLVALAGPGMNLLLAIVGAVRCSAVTVALSEPADGAGDRHSLPATRSTSFSSTSSLASSTCCRLPPFDGGHVVEGLLPPPLAARFRQIGRYLAAGVHRPASCAADDLAQGGRDRPRRRAAGRPAIAGGLLGLLRHSRFDMLHGWIILDKPVGLGSTHGGQRGQAHPARSRRTEDQSRPRRHARPAGKRRSADRARRSDQARRADARRDQGL